jgi:hypothetical protein
MKTYRIEGKIIHSYRLRNSVNGNPRYYFILLTDGTTREFKTRSDTAVGYKFKLWNYYEVVVDYHITRTGNFMCDDIAYGTYKGV